MSALPESAPTTDDITAHAFRVLEARSRRDVIANQLAALEAEFREIHAALYDASNTAKIDTADAEAALRDLALKHFHATGDKQPGPGVTVAVGQALLYDPDEALEWATKHGLALKLDVKAFEAFAATSPRTMSGIVRVKDAPQTKLARDMAAALAIPF